MDKRERISIPAVRYFARNDLDKAFDSQLRDSIRKGGDKAIMALYIQNQEILNILRRISLILEEPDE